MESCCLARMRRLSILVDSMFPIGMLLLLSFLQSNNEPEDGLGTSSDSFARNCCAGNIW